MGQSNQCKLSKFLNLEVLGLKFKLDNGYLANF
jgi:hypothetical protein